MKIMIDTNIIIDIFTKRMPWFDDSYAALSKTLADDQNECLFSASAVTDVFYMLRKSLGSKDAAKQIIGTLSEMVTIADVQSVDIQRALSSEMNDFEDAVVDAVAERHGAVCILTRNIKDFAASNVAAVDPATYLLDDFAEKS